MVNRLLHTGGDVYGGFSSVREVRDILLATDWAATPLGPMSTWPEALQATLRTVLHAASPMAVLIGPTGIVVCNSAAREMFGDEWATAQGRSIFDILPVADDFYRTIIADCQEGQSYRLRDQPLKLTRDGARVTCWFNLGISAVVDSDGTFLGVMVASSETSEHVRTRRALTRAQRRVDAALAAGGIVGTWDYCVLNATVTVDGGLAELYGFPAASHGQGLPVSDILTHVIPDDKPRLLQVVKDVLASHGDFQARFRTSPPVGNVRSYVATGRPVHDMPGHLTGYSGIVVDVTAQSEVAAALAASKVRFETLVESIPQIVWSRDAKGEMDFANHRYSNYTGFRAVELAEDERLNLIHPDDRESVRAAWTESLSNGTPYELDHRMRARDGTYSWFRSQALPIREPDGQISRWFGTMTDIQDAKLLESRRELVNRELDHRIGNLFALVSGLISLSARDYPEARAFAQELKERLQTLNRAHRLLRGHPSQSAVPMDELLRDMLAPYAVKTGAPHRITGESLRLNPGILSAFTLIFHELATNSAKYGALAVQGGQLSVDIQQLGDTVVIDWQEDGILTPAQPEPSLGFGSRLLSSVIEGQFRGQFERHYTPRGLRVTLRLPAAVTVAPES